MQLPRCPKRLLVHFCVSKLFSVVLGKLLCGCQGICTVCGVWCQRCRFYFLRMLLEHFQVFAQVFQVQKSKVSSRCK